MAFSLIAIAALLCGSVSPKASAHALSASYTMLNFEQDRTEMVFSLDVISVLESMDVDTNKNGILEENEMVSNEHRLEEWISDCVVLEMDNKEQTASFSGLKLEKKGDKEVVTWTFVYPAFSPGQSISINDGLYSDGKSSYANLMTFKYGDQTSETVLSGNNRVWTILLTEPQQQQEQSSTETTNAATHFPPGFHSLR